MGEMSFHMSDLYPGYSVQETSTEANPEPEDLEVLNEDAEEAEESSPKASSKNIFIALGLFVALIIFFGGGK